MPKNSVPIELGGKIRHLRYDFNALEILEDELGTPISDIGSVFGVSKKDAEKIQKGEDVSPKKVDIKKLKLIIWAGLLHEDENLTKKDVGSWLDFSNITLVFEKIALAFVAAYPDEEDVKKKEKTLEPGMKEKPGIGDDT